MIEAPLPGRTKTKRSRKTDWPGVINAPRYLVRVDREWHILPNNFSPWQTVYYWFRLLMRRLLFRAIHDLALMLDRILADRPALPSAGIVDSQSVGTTGQGAWV